MLTLLEYFLLAILIAVDITLSRWLGYQSYSWMPPQATAEAQRVDDLFSFLVAVGSFILLGLLSVMLYAVIFFRAAPDDFSEGHPMRGSVKIEIAWLVVPTLLVLWFAAQNFNIYSQLNIFGLKQIVQNPLEAPAEAAIEEAPKTAEDTPKTATEAIEVIAKQWVWSFRYPNSAVSHELHLPINQSTRLNLNSEDVIHGFYVPAFRLKQDIVPNRGLALVVTPTRIGKYRLQDSQFSGADFALMQTDVYVDSREAYDRWLLAAKQQTVSLEAAEPFATTSLPGAPTPKPFLNSGWQTGTSVQRLPVDREALLPVDRAHSLEGNL